MGTAHNITALAKALYANGWNPGNHVEGECRLVSERERGGAEHRLIIKFDRRGAVLWASARNDVGFCIGEVHTGARKLEQTIKLIERLGSKNDPEPTVGTEVVGDYKIIESEGVFRVMEDFGSHRVIKTRYKTRASAVRKIKTLPGKPPEAAPPVTVSNYFQNRMNSMITRPR